jgi:MoaA/NifB/PqqE/SkfB family radical SAM enzyme
MEHTGDSADLFARELNPLKVLHHYGRLLALAEGREIAPVTVEIDPVAYCNHTCGWCVDPIHTKTRMPFALFRRLIDELAQFRVADCGVEGIVFKGGGEPTLHPRFAGMLEIASNHGFSVGVVTNGSRLQRYAAPLSRHAAYVRVSLDGPTPESHHRVHGSRDFRRVIAGVVELISARAGRRHPVVGLSFAMDIHTVGLADEALRLSETLGADYALLRPPFFEEVGRVSTMRVDQAQEVREALQRAAAGYAGGMEVMIGNWVGDIEQKQVPRPGLQESGRRDSRLDRRLPVEHRTGRCPASPLLAVVTADGTLYGCCNLRGLAPWAMGRLDYAARQGFAALWAGRERAEVLAKMQRGECLPHCTHPMARYNEMIEVLRDLERPHSQFV